MADKEKKNVYESCDKAIMEMNREALDAFGRLKMERFDKIHLINTVKEMYRRLSVNARKRYKMVAIDAFVFGWLMIFADEDEALEEAKKAITDAWVEEILRNTDFVTLYRFDSETERKAMRLAEALESPEQRNAEIDKALRFWSQQVGQYAINFTDYAVQRAFKAAGVERVKWKSAHDNAVCNECYALDGQEFGINEIPAKPHWRCRCTLIPVGEG